jgi:hypothetical protein
MYIPRTGTGSELSWLLGNEHIVLNLLIINTLLRELISSAIISSALNILKCSHVEQEARYYDCARKKAFHI